VAIVENGSCPDQRITLTTLTALGDVAQRAAIESPALLIVGEVAALAAELHWFGSPPRPWEAMRSAA
jgi:uroporphyrin-III C-methyltransferase/precorrin-2 dehydrogenase/sirohydrochlorin ferrochelatase